MENNVLELIKYVVGTFAEKKDEAEYVVEEKEQVIENVINFLVQESHVSYKDKENAGK